MSEATDREAATGQQVTHERVVMRDLPPQRSSLGLLGARLAVLLDDDQWNNCEPHLLDAWMEIKRLRWALEELVNEPQPLGIDRPTYQQALKLIDA